MIRFSNKIFFKKRSVLIKFLAKLYIIFFVVPLSGSEITNFLHKDGYKLAGAVVGVYITDSIVRNCLNCPPVEVYVSNQNIIDPNASATDANADVLKKWKEKERKSQESILQSIVSPSFSVSSSLKIKLNVISSVMYAGSAFLGWHIVESYE